jgi:3-dehydroquinate dehydratase/shikimate dehydrogenase
LSQPIYRNADNGTLALLLEIQLHKWITGMNGSSPPEKICLVVRESKGADFSGAILQARQNVGLMEFRLDYLEPGEITPARVSEWIGQAGCPVILTLRRKANGGEFLGSESEQMELLRQLAEVEPSYVDLEIETIENFLHGDLTPLKKGGVQWVASYHDFENTPEDLNAVYRRLLSAHPDVIKVATFARSFADNFRLLELTSRAKRDHQPIVSAAMGELGSLTRLLAPGAGSLWTYASLGKGQESAPGQFTLEEMRELYAVGQIGQSTRIYGVIGYPVGHSLSPHIHNAAFRQLGLNARYLPFAIETLADFGPHLRKFEGFSVTIPHKVAICDYADAVDKTVKAIGAANTLVKREGEVVAYNTDIDGICFALREPLEQGVRRVTLLGTGGAARAAAWVLKQRGSRVMVLARDSQKARHFAREFGFSSDTLGNAPHYSGDLLINATPVGMHPRIDESPVPGGAPGYRYVFDMVYNPLETRLMRETRGQAKLISGLEMFVGQAVRQFELWTGSVAPAELMREVALGRLQQ